MNYRVRATILVVSAAAAGVARAQEAKPAASFTGDLGFVSTAGNSHLTTLSLGDKLTLRAGKVLLTQTFALVYGRNDGEQNANSQLVRGRADYSLGSRLSGYSFVGYERNRFAGIDHRTDESIGLQLAAWKSERNQLDLETGLGLVQQHLLVEPGGTVTEDFISGRAAARYKHLFSKATYFQQTVEFLPNLETTSDYRVNSESALVAPISRHIGLKASYLIKYNHAPPSADLAKSDRMFTTGVQISY